MKPFYSLVGIVAPLDRPNIDTDAIIPKQFLKSIHRKGFGKNLFDGWRYLDVHDANEQRSLNTEFILNQVPYDKAQILLARENFGCGSSREHAVWALQDFGFKVVLAPSFADIFYTNAFKNGLLLITLTPQQIDELFTITQAQRGISFSISLETQSIHITSDMQYRFEIDQNLKARLLKGKDDIAVILDQYMDKIRAYEDKQKQTTPWLFNDLL